MRKSTSHAAKTKSEREYYSKAIRNLDYEPTVDDAIKFPETDEGKSDYSLQRSIHKRRINLKQRVLDHMEENWIKWVLAGTAIVIGYLVYDSKINISVLMTKVETIVSEISELKNNEKANVEKLHQHDLEIQEAKFKIESVEKSGKK